MNSNSGNWVSYKAPGTRDAHQMNDINMINEKQSRSFAQGMQALGDRKLS